MNLYFRVTGDKLIFFGPGTYHKRDALKAHGARFNGADKTWVLDANDVTLQMAADIGARTMEDPGMISTQPSAVIPRKIIVDTPTHQGSHLEAATPGGLTVSQLMAEATRAIAIAFPNPVWVVGEIQNISRRGEHVFLEIAEGKEGSHTTATMTVKASIWGSSMGWLEKRHGKERIADVLVDGTKVRFLCRVSLYKDRGSLSLTIEDIDPAFSQGALALARAELLKKLRTQGLDRKNKGLKLTSFPLRVALISAAESRAHTDFEHQLTGSGQFPGTLIFIACPMQGDRVPKAVVKSLKTAEAHRVDVIVISRGGGSAADLRWFDGEEIALAIANCSVPVIAAIGHHDDTCVAEEIAHTRQKTPTAAAEFILSVLRDTRTQINEHAHWLARSLDRSVEQFQKTMHSLRERLTQTVSVFFLRHEERLQVLSLNLGRGFELSAERQRATFIQWAAALHRSAVQRLSQNEQKLFQTANHLQSAAQGSLMVARETLAGLEQQLTRVDPQPWLNTGWTQLSRKGKPLKTVRDFKPGDEVQARLRDGLMTLSVTNIQSKTPDQTTSKE